jgi:hypothetical protein
VTLETEEFLIKFRVHYVSQLVQSDSDPLSYLNLDNNNLYIVEGQLFSRKLKYLFKPASMTRITRVS